MDMCCSSEYAPRFDSKKEDRWLNERMIIKVRDGVMHRREGEREIQRKAVYLTSFLDLTSVQHPTGSIDHTVPVTESQEPYYRRARE